MTNQNRPRPARPTKPGPFKAGYAKGITSDASAKMIDANFRGDDLFVVRERFKAVCKKCYVYLSPKFRDSEAEADSDAQPHHNLTGHRYGIEKTYST
jgi:hypothetical protein